MTRLHSRVRPSIVLTLACAAALCGSLSSSPRARAQAAPPAQPESPVAAPAPAPAPATPTLEQQVQALTTEVAAQRAELAAQREELSEQKAELEAQRAKQAEAALLGELEQEGTSESETESAEPVVRIYGFADAGLQHAWGPIAVVSAAGTDKTTFVLGNVNLYFDANPVPDWRFLSEVRFGLFPGGATQRGAMGATVKPINTSVSDDGSPNGGFTDIRWNGVVLERAHIDWTPRDEINLRVGYFLTPYGIWNVDHGTPTRIMIEPPLFITSQMIPERQLGVELFGRAHALPWTLGYHAYVSNGRTGGHVDFSDDKALGARVFASTRFPLPFTVGVSGFTGRSEVVEKNFGLAGDGSILISTTETQAFRDYALSADVSADLGALRLRTEGVFRWTIYEDGKRDEIIPGQPTADRSVFGAYLLAAYQLPWLGLEPLVQGELLRLALPFGEYAGRISGGLNIYLTEATTLRMAYTYSRLFDLEGPVRELKYDYFHNLVSRLIVAF